MLLKSLKLSGFKSFAKKTTLELPRDISAIVGPNGSGKSNVVEAIAWVLGEQSLKSLRGKRGQDLVFSGSDGAPRTSKASVVLSFSPLSGRVYEDIELGVGDEVLVSRTVYKDGINEYHINNSRCRLKDIVEFLSKIGLGASRHHIINQGESDRILNSSPKERREMIEDALGLRAYQLKRDEGKRKLERTEENMEQVQSLRNEIQPHLRFLKKQVDKATKTVELKEKLKNLSISYFSTLETQFQKETQRISSEREQPQAEFLKTQRRVSEIKEQTNEFSRERAKDKAVSGKVNLLEREIGRCEVILSQVREREDGPDKEKASFSLDFKEIESFIDKLEKNIEHALSEESVESIKNILREIKLEIAVFLKKEEKQEESFEDKDPPDEGETRAIEDKYNKLLDALKSAKEEEYALEKVREDAVELERGLYQLEIKLSGLKNVLQVLGSKEQEIKLRRDEMKRDLEEVEAILREKIVIQEVDVFDNFDLDKERRSIERMKIRLEESGGIGEEILKEYEEVKTRDEFLSAELADLESSAVSLKELIDQLDIKIDSDFKNGILKINNELGRFFQLMFGGGGAELKIKKKELRTKNEEEEVETEEGIDISVNLPRKKITSLDMLSGGERALISIALLFAMSQVNPPPFLILDETDAALDEANSRKYAKLLCDLSKQTQLVLVTHNRETMGAAGVLYGVTMDSSGVSRLLSIKLEEAEELAGS